jgi:LysR family glycine cleavage system transcriptional activator
MTGQLPSLMAIRAFEAAARHSSFKVAAEELNVTHSAISHQIKGLETELGVRLFDRHTRRVDLTDAGRLYFVPIRQAFDRMRDASEAVRLTAHAQALTVQVYVTMAMRWFLTRLPDFHARHPDIDVQLSTTDKDWAFNRGTVDAGFLYVRNKEPGMYYKFLYRGRMFPVISPTLLDRFGPLNAPRDLITYPLLSVYTAPDDWSIYFDAAGVPDPPVLNSISYDSYIIAQEAAIAGEGVAMTEMAFVRSDLESGRLISPFDLRVSRPGNWCFACEKGREREPRIKEFESWLADQVENDPDMVGAAAE